MIKQSQEFNGAESITLTKGNNLIESWNVQIECDGSFSHNFFAAGTGYLAKDTNGICLVAGCSPCRSREPTTS